MYIEREREREMHVDTPSMYLLAAPGRSRGRGPEAQRRDDLRGL